MVELDHVWLWTGFSRLSTTRQSSGFGRSEISYLALVKYAREMGMPLYEREFLWEVIQKLDKIYLKRLSTKITKPAKKKP